MGTVKATLRKRGISGDKFPIIIRIIHARKTKEVSIENCRVSLEDWNDKKMRVKEANPRSAVLNSIIKKQIRKFEDSHDELASLDKPFDVVDIVQNANVNKEKVQKVFVDYLSKYIESNPDELSEGTLTYYRTTLKRCNEVLKSKRIVSISSNDIIALRKHLMEVGNSTNTIYKIMKTVRKMLHKAKREGLIGHNPFQGIKLKQETGSREHLVLEELHALEDYNEPDDLALVKDVFLFSCYTGLRISDICTLKASHLQWQNGHCRLKMKMSKTNDLLSFGLNNRAKLIIKKYQKRSQLLIFPIINEVDLQNPVRTTKRISSKNARLNRLLKDLIRLAGISKKISMHCARHTFAVVSLELGADLYVLSKMLGHSSIAITELYAKIVDKRKDELTELWNF